jgi:flagellar hook-associated protein 1 FlgK
MSISGALNNASLGLAVTARLADTISNNVSNAMTPGFGRRVTEVSSLALGGYGSGVRVVGTTRTENPFLTAERRAMDAALGAASATSNVYERISGALGEPGSPAALATRATALETRLMSAVASPQSLTQLTDAVAAARALAQSMNGVAQENTRLRTEADAEIARQVKTMNDGLHGVRELNLKITTLSLKGEDVSALKDERERVIDSLSSIVPLRVANRENETVALYAANGGTLLDGRVWELKFTRGPTTVTPDMTLGAPLSGLAQAAASAARLRKSLPERETG